MPTHHQRLDNGKKQMAAVLGLALLCLLGFSHAHAHADEVAIYVAASGELDGGDGSAHRPIVLTAGREYFLNRLIRRAADSGNDVEVRLLPGIYFDVRLQLIKQGIDSDTLAELFPGADGVSKSVRVGERSYHYLNHGRCNSDGVNCRVAPEDYALGPHSSARVVVRSLVRHGAIFDGSRFRDQNPDLQVFGAVVSGAYFGVVELGKGKRKSEQIKNIQLTGIVFRGYRNGILIQYAAGVHVDDCVIEDVGSRASASHQADAYGFAALSVKGDSRLVLFTRNRIEEAWNTGATDVSKSTHWPSLMHSVYNGYCRDVIFIDNELIASSGALVKFGTYPIIRDGKLLRVDSGESWSRRHFFVHNLFEIESRTAYDGTSWPDRTTLAFVHDNSRVAIDAPSRESPPMAGAVFVNNDFINAADASYAGIVALVRQELPRKNSLPLYKDFFFYWNTLTNVSPAKRAVVRVRGTPLNPDFALSANLTQSGAKWVEGPPRDYDQALALISSLLAAPLRSPVPADDAAVLEVLRNRAIPKLN